MLSRQAAQQIRVVLSDFDDTLTTDGRLSSAAYAALEELQRAGLWVILVTGRPAGWCDLIARFWPVDGVVGENGAFYFRYDRPARRMQRSYWALPEERSRNRQRLDALGARILAAVPGAALSADQPYRIADLAIDFCEDIPPLSTERIEDILQFFTQEGANAKASSIHVNGWFGDYDKLRMTREMLSAEFGIDLDRHADQLLFIGDSPNDEPLFRAFPLSVGVANIVRSQVPLRHLPHFVTNAESGAGFVELVNCIVSAKLHDQP